MGYTVLILIIIAIGMQVFSIRKNEDAYKRTNGIIRTRQDLLAVKEAINLSMRLAVIYIALFILFIVILVVFVINGAPIGNAILSLFIFGVVTLPVGLIGKQYEKKIKSMQVQSDDPELAKKFQEYLVQWNEPRFQLPD
jgi:hypothetical protein